MLDVRTKDLDHVRGILGSWRGGALACSDQHVWSDWHMSISQKAISPSCSVTRPLT